MDFLRDRTAAFFDDVGADLFVAPWAARDAYGTVIDAPAERRARFARERGRGPLAAGATNTIRRGAQLLEMQRAALLMYASCGWFFDDVAGLESALVIAQAAHVLDLWATLGARPPTGAFLERLAEARSNDSKLGTGADVFRRVLGARVTPAAAVARAAFANLVRNAHAPRLAPMVPRDVAVGVPGFEVILKPRKQELSRTSGATMRGSATVRHRRSGETNTFPFIARYEGEARLSCVVGRQRLAIDDVDDAGAHEIRLAAILNIGDRPPTLLAARAALALVRKLGPLTVDESAAVERVISGLVIGLLGATTPARIRSTTLARVAELAAHLNLTEKIAERRIIEERIWEVMTAFRASGRALPRALRTMIRLLSLSEE